jgi:hypothetical protein
LAISVNRGTLQIEKRDDLLDLSPDANFRAARRGQETQLRQIADGGMAMPADQQILQQRGVGEQLDILEGPRDAQAGDGVWRRAGDVLAVEHQLAFGGVIDPADQIEDRRLAGAIGADDRKHLALLDIES